MKKIILTGGGTAGHVTPNIALLPSLKEAGYEVFYIGSYTGIEKTLIENLDIPYYGISSGKLRRYKSFKNLTDPFRVIKGYFQARRLMRRIKPDIIFSKGGFVSVPVVLAAGHKHIPVIIHESDMTTQQMKSKWGKDYEDNYNLVKDCTAATSGLAIRYNDKYIEARYTYITSGSTLSGASILGDEYAYLSAVECNNDKNAQDYLVVKTISNKDFVNSFEKKYDSINLDKNNLAQQIQIVSKNEAGYVLKLQIGNVVMSGSEFAYVLGINSPNFSIEYMQTGVKITTIGVGEGFGVSVYTADCMAKAGSSYEDIIETFYNKINIISE